MAPNLTIRNLTSTPIELKLVERFETPKAGFPKPSIPGSFSDVGKGFSNVTSFVSKTISSGSIAAPTSAQLEENANSFARQDVNVRVDPFTINSTDVAASERGPNEIIRLTFETDGQRYRVDTPGPKASSKLIPLQQDSRRDYTAVYLPNDNFLSIYSSANLDSWMRELRDEVALSSLSIPGTHNSPTCNVALPSVRCQAVSPYEQLLNGVRFFDIRVQPENPNDPSKDGLILVHGVFPISLTGNKYLRDLVNETLRFLDEHPSETVLMSIKREGPGEHNDQQLSKILHDHYTQDQSRWYTDSRLPRLGETRRKIVLMRRFCIDDSLRGDHDGRGYGINIESWAYNCKDFSREEAHVQDFCEVDETTRIDEKIQCAQEHLGRSGREHCPIPGIDADRENPPPVGPFYLNFLSASNFWKVGCWPEKVAARLNPAVTDYLCRRHHEGEGDGQTGVVICDWVGGGGDWDLVRCIVGMNTRLMMKGQ